MYNLIVKDIIIQKKQVIFSFVYILFIIFAMQYLAAAMFPAGVVAFTYMLVMTSCAYEDKSKADIMLNSLPVKRTNIVAAKYLSAFVYFVMGSAAYVIFTGIISMLRIPVNIYSVTFEVFIIGIVAISLMAGIYYPIFFKFGYIKSKAVSFIMFFVFFFGVASFMDILKKSDNRGLGKSIVHFLRSQGDTTIVIGTLVVIFIFLFISYGLSVRFYAKREF